MSIEQALVDVAARAGLLAPVGYDLATYSNTRGNFGSLVAAPFPVQSTYQNPFYDQSGPFVGLMLCFTLLFPVSRLIKVLVEDKESRSKETLKMMGLLAWVYPLSYALTYLVVFTVIAILQTALMKASVIFGQTAQLRVSVQRR